MATAELKRKPRLSKIESYKAANIKEGAVCLQFLDAFSILDAPINKTQKNRRAREQCGWPATHPRWFFVISWSWCLCSGFLVFVLSVLLRGIWNTRPSLSVRMYKSRAARLEQHAISFFSFALSM